jgi:hypothetical protein
MPLSQTWQRRNLTVVVNIFSSDIIELEHPTMQTNVTTNAEEEGEQRHLLQKVLPIIAQEDP